MDTICNHGIKEWAISPLTAKPRRSPPAARSQKIRPQQDAAPVDTSRLGRFPPPTPWSEQLAADNLQLACAMASRLARTTRMPFDDLYLVAAQGLLKGCRYYDPQRINPATGTSYRLSTCVVPFIRGTMAQWLRDRGHSSGVRFPDRWRDKAPSVRRLTSGGASLEQVAETTGLPAADVEEILEAQGTTRSIDLDLHGFATFDPDPWDDIETFDELAEALRIADQAYDALRRADREMLQIAWAAPKRPQLARLPHGQFLAKVRGIIRGEEHEEQQKLATDLPHGSSPTAKPIKKLNDPAEILWVAEQLALGLDVTEVGKTASAGHGLAGETSGDQPSDRSGQSPVISPSGSGGSDDGSGIGSGLLGAATGGSEKTTSPKRRGRTRKSV